MIRPDALDLDAARKHLDRLDEARARAKARLDALAAEIERQQAERPKTVRQDAPGRAPAALDGI